MRARSRSSRVPARRYRASGTFARNDVLSPRLLPGLIIELSAVWAE
jgi:hypothetical protein